MGKYDIEAIASQSKFEDVDRLALYIAKNTDTPEKKLARVTGLTTEQVASLMTDKQFRERLTEVLTYAELTPDREVAILRRMIREATDPNSDFRDFKDAATWVYRQGGMLRADKAQVDVGGAIRVAFTLDPSAEGRPRPEGSYVAPDPLAGIVGLPGSTAEDEEEVTDVDFEPARHAGIQAGEESDESEGEPGPVVRRDDLDRGDAPPRYRRDPPNAGFDSGGGAE
jgi:hypothetical protein